MNILPVRKSYFVLMLILSLGMGEAFGKETKKKIIIDAHTHIGSPQLLIDFPILQGAEGSLTQTTSKLISALDQAHIDAAFVISHAYLYLPPLYTGLDLHDKVKAENDFIASEVARLPKRLLGFCAIPFTPEWALEEIKRCHNELGFVGLKLHLANNQVDLRKPEMLKRYEDILNLAASFKMPVVIHANIKDQESFENTFFTAAGSGATVIFAHCLQESWRFLAGIAHLKDGHSPFNNIYVDTSAFLIDYAMAPPHLRSEIVWTIRMLNPSQILMGSDSPIQSPVQSRQSLQSFNKKALGAYGFSEDEIRNIEGPNALELLKKVSNYRQSR